MLLGRFPLSSPVLFSNEFGRAFHKMIALVPCPSNWPRCTEYAHVAAQGPASTNCSEDDMSRVTSWREAAAATRTHMKPDQDYHVHWSAIHSVGYKHPMNTSSVQCQLRRLCVYSELIKQVRSRHCARRRCRARRIPKPTRLLRRPQLQRYHHSHSPLL